MPTSAEIIAACLDAVRIKTGKSYTKKNLAADMEISPQYLSDVTTGRRDIGKSIAEKLSYALSKYGIMITPGHILDGLNVNEESWQLAANNEFVGITHINGKPTNGKPVMIPYYRVSASAGSGTFIEDHINTQQLYFMSGWIQNDLGTSPKDLLALDVYGDSMEPTLHDGDTVLVDTTRNHLKTNGLYVFEMGEMLLVKRVELLPDGSLLIKSDNPGYEPITLRPEEEGHFSVKGRVVWRAGTKF